MRFVNVKCGIRDGILTRIVFRASSATSFVLNTINGVFDNAVALLICCLIAVFFKLPAYIQALMA